MLAHHRGGGQENKWQMGNFCPSAMTGANTSAQGAEGQRPTQRPLNSWVNPATRHASVPQPAGEHRAADASQCPSGRPCAGTLGTARRGTSPKVCPGPTKSGACRRASKPQQPGLRPASRTSGVWGREERGQDRSFRGNATTVKATNFLHIKKYVLGGGLSGSVGG